MSAGERGRKARVPDIGSQGYVLITVVVLLAVLASVVFLVNFEGSAGAEAAGRQFQTTQARLVAEAGYQEAKWILGQTTSCSGYANLPSTAFGPHSFAVDVAPTSGSPVTLTATGTLSSGARNVLQKSSSVMRAPADVVLQPDSSGIDTYLWDGAHQGKNFGATDHISLNNASAERTALIQFDLSPLPPGAVIGSAVLELWLDAGAGSVSNGVIDAHRVSRAWVEGNLDDQSPPAGGGATYQSYDGQTNWTTFGGDYEPTVVASVTIPSLAPAWVAWDITDAADAWHTGALANDGLLLRASGGTVNKIEFLSSDNVVVANRPKLTVGPPLKPRSAAHSAGMPLRDRSASRRPRVCCRAPPKLGLFPSTLRRVETIPGRRAPGVSPGCEGVRDDRVVHLAGSASLVSAGAVGDFGRSSVGSAGSPARGAAAPVQLHRTRF